MKFNYIIVALCDGCVVTGTDSKEIAMSYAETVNFAVIDAKSGTIHNEGLETAIEEATE